MMRALGKPGEINMHKYTTRIIELKKIILVFNGSEKSKNMGDK